MTTGIAYLAALTLAVTFAYTGLAKLRDASASRRALKAAGAPVSLAVPVAILELVAAVALIVVPSIGAVFALGLLTLFTLFVSYLIAKKIDVSCGCFGVNATEPVSAVDVIRNVMLVALAVVAIPAQPTGVALEEVILVSTCVALGAVVLATIATRHKLGQLFDNRLPGER